MSFAQLIEFVLALLSMVLASAPPTWAVLEARHAAGDPLVVGGYVSAYGHEPTLGTLQYRLHAGDIPADFQYDTLVAVADCGRVGHSGWLVAGGGEVALRALAYDCAGPDAAAWMNSEPISVEIDWWAWERHPEIVHRWAYLLWDTP